MRVSATGALPGINFRDCLAEVLEIFPDSAPFPELPHRGPTSNMIGHAAGLLIDMPVELTVSGWQLCSSPGKDYRKLVSQWNQDLDDLEELAQNYQGSIKITICGPWTLAAGLGRPRAEAALADVGARKELSQSLALGITQLFDKLSRRIKGAKFELQIDEPKLTSILNGQISSASGYNKLPAVQLPDVATGLKLFSEITPFTLNAGNDFDWNKLINNCGAKRVYMNISQDNIDWVGSWLESSGEIILGVLPVDCAKQLLCVDNLVSKVLDFVDMLGISPIAAAEQFLISATSGLAMLSITQARDTMKTLVRASELITEQLIG